MKILLVTIIALVFVGFSIQESFTEQIPSPRQQLADGISPEDIQCRENRVLVLRSNGSPACVTEKTAEKIGWEIIETFIVQNIPVIPEKTIEIIPKEKISWILDATDLSYMDLEKIPNPEGYWVPIENRDVFAQQFANAAGEEITNVKKYGLADYYTTNGKIHMYQFFTMSSVWSSVSYKIFEVESIKSETEQLPFINNFMNNMGFKLNGNTLSLTESFLETCEGNDFYRHCIFDDKNSIGKNISKDKTIYTLAEEGGSIKFSFYDGGYAHYGEPSISIEFDGWTNHPELIQHPLGENIALEKAREFVLANEYLNKQHTVGENSLQIRRANADICEAEIRANDDYLIINPIVIAGVPFYETNIAKCTFPYTDGHWHQPLILVDGWTGEYVFREFYGGLD